MDTSLDSLYSHRLQVDARIKIAALVVFSGGWVAFSASKSEAMLEKWWPAHSGRWELPWGLVSEKTTQEVDRQFCEASAPSQALCHAIVHVLFQCF